MHVHPEGVVPPDDVAEQLVVPAIVRRVDDPLLLPRAPGVRPGGAKCDTLGVGQGEQLLAPLRHTRGQLVEGVAPAGSHLDL